MRHVEVIAIVSLFDLTPTLAHSAECVNNLEVEQGAMQAIISCMKELNTENTTLKNDIAALSKARTEMPVGTVMAFDDPTGCSKLGDGWQDANFGGKILLGADQTKRWAYRVSGGRTEVTIDKLNIPPLYLGFHSKLSGPGETVSDIETLSFDKPNSQAEVHTSTASAQAIDTSCRHISPFTSASASNDHYMPWRISQYTRVCRLGRRVFAGGWDCRRSAGCLELSASRRIGWSRQGGLIPEKCGA